MSIARIGVAAARPCAWSAAHSLTSLPKREDQARIAQPEPPASAFAMVVNSARHAMTRLGKPGGRIVAVSAERNEIDLVQDHRARSNQLFALEAIGLERGRARPVECRKTRSNGVQPSQRAAVVIFVMAHEQSL